MSDHASVYMGLIADLEREREALLVKNEKLKADYDELFSAGTATMGALVKMKERAEKAEAERDALRAENKSLYARWQETRTALTRHRDVVAKLVGALENLVEAQRSGMLMLSEFAAKTGHNYVIQARAALAEAKKLEGT